MNIKTVVVYNKKTRLIKDDIHIPVNAGRIFINEQSIEDQIWLRNNTIGDDTGDNISEKNHTYNELTAVYWVWKNYEVIGNPDFIGLEHYRRQLILNDLGIKNNEKRWTVDFKTFDEDMNEYLNKIGDTHQNIESIVCNFPIVAGCYNGDHSVLEQYKLACKYDAHIESDIYLIKDLIDLKFSDYSKAATIYLNGKKHYFGNMFIFKKEIFFEYCSFIFSVLKLFEQHIDLAERSEWQKRFFISERLTGIFITKKFLEGYQIKDVPVAFIEHPDIIEPLDKKFKNKDSVNIVFSVDVNYLKYLSVVLTSIIVNADHNKFYDINILYTDISSEQIDDFVRRHNFNSSHFSIRFINIEPYLSLIPKKDLYIEIHVTLSTYYRFFIQKIFKNYKKIIYLDVDTVCLDDISKLLDIDTNGRMISACIDLRECLAAKLELPVSYVSNWKKYLTDVLELEDPYKYFQAGLIIFDIEKLNQIDLLTICFDRLKSIKRPILSDQDILNSIFQNNVYFLPSRWNIEWQIESEFPAYMKLMSSNHYLMYQNAIKYPGIFHFASSVKPWHDPCHKYSYYWWKFARISPYYEELLNDLVNFNLLFINNRVQSLSHDVFNKPFNHIKYYKYRLLSHILTGKKKSHYKNKYHIYRDKLK